MKKRVLSVLIATGGLVAVMVGSVSADPGSYTIQPIRCPMPAVYQVNVDQAGSRAAEAIELTRMAADMVQESMGQQMIYGGLTHKVPTLENWSEPGPLVMAFVSPGTSDFWPVATPWQIRGYTYWTGDGRAESVVSPYALQVLPVIAEHGPSAFALVQHEFAHLVGVHVHSDNPADLMFYQFNDQTPWTFNDGDRALLAALPCITR